ncbi:hypothetical protein [Cellulomonas sp. Leaf334]|uniref:hypothetical protein n=1 Tax=Cellulomonas sp. Leaf334 TaxID=1736339 RepID=UPI0006FF62DE|nr:hypothetical protein [Cellulomonas sp. Leaf334]KQR17261.1 hypothetical protein ASF78_08175 [Cellulomonas sp. Leaf334]
MLAAGEAWLVWCAAHGGNPLDATVDDIRRAALDVHEHGGTETDVVDLVDQVGFMTGLWRSTEWLLLRRTILIPMGEGPLVQRRSEVRVQDGVLGTHDPAKCADDDASLIHRPSRHPLQSAPMAWHAELGLLERICGHGIHHPDLDALAYARRTRGTSVGDEFAQHDCDGCCGKENR